MLSPDDAELAERDPALPGLATVLDDDRIAAAVRDAGANSLEGTWRRTYARYKPERSCVVAYELAGGGELQDVYAKAYRPARYTRHDRKRGQTVTLDDVAVVVHPASGDPRIESLSELASPTLRNALIARVFGPSVRSAGAAVATLRYWPERRYTCRLEFGEAKVALKLYSERPYATAARAAAALRDCDGPRLPRLIGSSGHDHALAFEWLPGVGLDDAIAEPGFDERRVLVVGRALAELHGHRSSGLRTSDPVARASFARQRSAWITRVIGSELGMRAHELAERAAAGLAEPAERMCTIHGDFSAAQVLIDREQVSILDLDGSAVGDPVADIGSFVATLERRAVDGAIAPARARKLTSSFLTGYERAGHAVDHSRLALWTATELIARAPNAFRRPDTRWRERVAALIGRAGEVLEAGGP